MQNLDEFVCSNDQILIKGKRTKRQRVPSPCTSSSITTHDSSSDQEDEDMANCLILLAQGDGVARKVEKDMEICGGSSKKFLETVTPSAAGIKAGFYVYECKTCNRTFPSFQALGGHRASHKRPKMMMMMNLGVEDKKIQELKPPLKDENIMLDKDANSCPSLTLQMVGKSSVQLLHKARKAHECSICGAEFTSGQALGGHMRRHRAAPPTAQISMSTSTTTTISSGLHVEADEKKPARNYLALDLNLPAPDDDQKDMKFQFVTPQQSLVLSSPALVDCHY